jgi:hypothetical protein
MSQNTETEDLQKDLELFMNLHQITSIEVVLHMEPAELLKMDGFGYRLMNYLFSLKNKT